VSASGIYLETKVPLKAGDDLRFTVLLSQEVNATLSLRCRACVLRADALEGCYGIGAAIRELRPERL